MELHNTAILSNRLLSTRNTCITEPLEVRGGEGGGGKADKMSGMEGGRELECIV